MNRGQRRALRKQQPRAIRGKTQNQILTELTRNGITPENLEKSFKEGFEAGFNAASPEITKTAYAAVVLALREEGFGQTRCKRVLTRMNDLILHTLYSIEAIDKVYEEIGLVLHLEDPLEPVQEVQK